MERKTGGSLPTPGIIDPTGLPKCKTIARIDAVRQEQNLSHAPAIELRYYISSRQLSADELAQAVRAHWGIETRLHWVLDVNFGEDASSLRKDHAPQNLSLLRKIALDLIRTDTTCPGKT